MKTPALLIALLASSDAFAPAFQPRVSFGMTRGAGTDLFARKKKAKKGGEPKFKDIPGVETPVTAEPTPVEEGKFKAIKKTPLAVVDAVVEKPAAPSAPAPAPEPVAEAPAPAPKPAPEPAAVVEEPTPAPEPVAVVEEPAPAPEPVAVVEEPAPAPEPVAVVEEPSPAPAPAPAPEPTFTVLSPPAPEEDDPDGFTAVEKGRMIDNVFDCHGYFPDFRSDAQLSAAVLKMRAQPKPEKELAAIKAKYGAMSKEDAAFSMLCDLGMMEDYDAMGEYSDDFDDFAM